MIGPLTELEIDALKRRQRLDFMRRRVRLPYAARTGKNLPSRQEREQRIKRLGRKLRLAAHQVILVAPKRRARVMVHVVLQKRHFLCDAKRIQRSLNHRIARQIERHHIAHRATLRRRIFEVPHIEVKPSSIQQKATIPRWLFIIAVMPIQCADTRFFEQVILNARRP